MAENFYVTQLDMYEISFRKSGVGSLLFRKGECCGRTLECRNVGTFWTLRVF